LIVVDTSFVVALYNERDAHHRDAAEVGRRLVAGEWGRGLLLEYVFVEVTTVVLARRRLETATLVARTLLRSRELDFVACSDIFPDVLETFTQQGSGTLSFTDAAILTVARQRDAAVATFDRALARAPGVAAVPI
jgi:predicted nucleic acid-binding protein